MTRCNNPQCDKQGQWGRQVLWEPSAWESQWRPPRVSHGLKCLSWTVVREGGLISADRQHGYSRKSQSLCKSIKAGQREGAWETWLHGGARAGVSLLAGTRVGRTPVETREQTIHILKFYWAFHCASDFVLSTLQTWWLHYLNKKTEVQSRTRFCVDFIFYIIIITLIKVIKSKANISALPNQVKK